jgi:hypothetical protein
MKQLVNPLTIDYLPWTQAPNVGCVAEPPGAEIKAVTVRRPMCWRWSVNGWRMYRWIIFFLINEALLAKNHDGGAYFVTAWISKNMWHGVYGCVTTSQEKTSINIKIGYPMSATMNVDTCHREKTCERWSMVIPRLFGISFYWVDRHSELVVWLA